MFKGEVLNRNEQAVASPEAPAVEEQARKPRRAAKPASSDAVAEKPKSRTVKAGDVQATDSVAPEAKAPAKRVRKAGTTDAAAN